VASAGNDGTCSPQYPAAFSGVVSVGGIGPSGPAPFSNYGPWVRACAPGVDILSTFFTNFNGRATAGASGTDPDLFQGWAIWSGTSFSGPAVVGALAKEMVSVGCTAKEAVERVVDAPSLMRIPDLGTVVNIT
jgi:subtilisin family serine protease